MEIRLMPSAFISEMQSKSIQFRNDSIHEVYLADGLVETNFFLVLSYGKIW